MTTHDDVARQLQSKMKQLRGRIEDQSEEAAERTRSALDWKNQVAAHPVIVGTVAFAVGYWLVPRRRKQPKVESLVEIHSVLENQSKPHFPALGFGKTLVLAAGSMLIKNVASVALSKAIEHFESWKDPNQFAHAEKHESTERDANTIDKGMPDDA